jgi:dienelactone hydrolase
MTRRTLLFLPALGAFPLMAQRPTQRPSESFPATPQQLREIGDGIRELEQRLAPLRKKNLSDSLLGDVEIFLKAAQWIVRFDEFLVEDAVAQTLSVLKTGTARAEELAAGKSSWTTAKGTVIRAYRSQLDGSLQPYRVLIPESYDSRKRVRLDIVMHGTNRRMAEVGFMARPQVNQLFMDADFIQLETLGRTNNAYRWAGEADVFEALEAAKRSYAIDADRVVLRGFSMGGASGWHLGLHHPDQWAAFEAGAGFTETLKYAGISELPPYQMKTLHYYDSADYSLNAFDVPTVGYGGEVDRQLQASTNIREQLMKEGFKFEPDGLNFTTKDLPAVVFLVGPETPHRWHPDSKQRSEAFIVEALKKGRTAPDHIRFVTYTTRFNRCFWVTVAGLEQHYERADVDARRSDGGTAVEVKTKNVSRLLLSTPGAKKVSIDGKNFEIAAGRNDLYFQKESGAWKEGRPGNGSLVKRHALQGPIDDAFMDSFLCVRPTGKAADTLAGKYAKQALDRFAAEFAKFFRGDIRVKDDTAVTPEDIAAHHLIVFGDAQSNRLIAKLHGKLPLQWNAKELTFGGKSYDASKHVVAMIYPNPLNPNRYVVVNSGHTFHENELWSTNAQLFPRHGDYAVLGLTQGAEGKVETEVVTAGFFDEQWKLPAHA